MRYFTLLLFLTLGMHGMYTADTAVVTEVRNGLVTMECESGVYQIEEHEAWRVGDRAEVIVGRNGIIEARWKR